MGAHGGSATILGAALDAYKALTALAFRAKAPARKGAIPADRTIVDLVVAPGKLVRFCAIERPNLKPEAVGALVELGRRMPHPLLVAAPYVDPETADRARELGLNFLDLAGNAHLRGPGLFVFTTGRRPAARPRPPRAPQALTPAGLKVVFALLLRPQRVQAPLREIAAETGVALGTVAGVMDDLASRGYVTQGAEDKRMLDPRRLAEEWALLYPVRLRPKLLRGRYTAADAAWWEKARLDPDRAVFGGEVAADRLTGQLKPASVTLYAWGAPSDVILANRLRPDEHGAVEILEAFWRSAGADARPANTAPPLLVYADLLATGDPRNLEVARLVRERHLDGTPGPA